MSEIKLDTNRLRECRERAGLSKNKTAKLIGVSQPAYLRYEAGERAPSIQVIKEIASVLGTSTDYLLDIKDTPESDSITISRADTPELYELVQKYRNYDNEQLKRLIAYVSYFK